MKGSLKKRYEGSWSLILDLDPEPVIDPETKQQVLNANGTPKMKRRQKWVTFRGNQKQAQKKLTELVNAANNHEYVEPAKVTLRQWLTDWLPGVKARTAPATYTRYSGIVEQHILKSALSNKFLPDILPNDIEAYYRSVKLSASTLSLHHTILQQAFRKAVKNRLVRVSPVSGVDEKPRRKRDKNADAREHCWTRDDARKFLDAAKKDTPQVAAFFALALDSGARKGELCGLRWSDVDLDAGAMRIERQLLQPGKDPVFGPLKAGRPRTITLSPETVRLLAAHRRTQAELKLKNRNRYRDFGLVFAKEYSDLRRGDMLGHPLQSNNLGQRDYARLIKLSGVPRIKFHGLRHTCATLLLAAGEPVHVVSERLGHSTPMMTLNVYSHVSKGMQEQAARTIGAALFGS